MSHTRLTNNEVFELVTELTANAASQQPGVLSIHLTDIEHHDSGKVIFKQLLITVGDELFEEYLKQCRNRHGVYSMNSCDDVVLATLTPRTKETLVECAMQAPEASSHCDNRAEFKELADGLLKNHAVLRYVFGLYSLRSVTNDIAFVIAPEHPEDFVEKMRAMRAEFPAEDVQFLRYSSEPDLIELQKGRPFDPATKKFVNLTN